MKYTKKKCLELEIETTRKEEEHTKKWIDEYKEYE
jgi:hypothetical protein